MLLYFLQLCELTFRQLKGWNNCGLKNSKIDKQLY